MAILLATQSPELQIEAITVVSGNVLVDQGVENALKLVELAGRTEIPVAKGRKIPTPEKADYGPPRARHERSWRDGTAYPGQDCRIPSRRGPDHRSRPRPPRANYPAAHGPIDQYRPSPAQAIRHCRTDTRNHPDGRLHRRRKRHPAAEANMYNDPEAAKIVFESGIPITMVGLGATHQTLLKRSHTATLADSQSPIARYVARIADFYLYFSESVGFEGGALHDPLAVGLAVDSSLAKESRPMHIAVETQGRLTYGETVANRYLLKESVEDAGDHYVLTRLEPVEPNTKIPILIDADRFLQFFMDRICAPPRALG